MHAEDGGSVRGQEFSPRAVEPAPLQPPLEHQDQVTDTAIVVHVLTKQLRAANPVAVVDAQGHVEAVWALPS